MQKCRRRTSNLFLTIIVVTVIKGILEVVVMVMVKAVRGGILIICY
jgi:hypothetical protein